MTKKTKLLTRDEELALFAASATDKRSLDKLVVANLGLVHKIVHKFPIKNASCSYDDLFQAGVEGLLHGISKYEPERGHRLSTYVYRWIQAYVSRYYQNHGKTIRIPVHLATAEMKMNKEVEAMTHELGHTPSQSEVEASVGDASVVMLAKRDCMSLNALVAEGDELECFAGEDRTEELDAKMEVELLLSRLSDEVSERDINMFVFRHGLNGKSPHTLNEIAEFHGVTRARVHQIVTQCFYKVQSYASTSA